MSSNQTQTATRRKQKKSTKRKPQKDTRKKSELQMNSIEEISEKIYESNGNLFDRYEQNELPEQLPIEKLGTNIDLKDVDVRVNVRKFVEVFVLHFLYFIGFGPIVCLGSVFNGTMIYRNLGFMINGATYIFKVFQVITWFISLNIYATVIIYFNQTGDWSF